METTENDVLLHREETEVHREVALGSVWALCWWQPQWWVPWLSPDEH